MKKILSQGYIILKKIFPKIFITVIFSSILLIIILNYQTKKINGDALSGYHDEGVYYILTDNNEYKEVSRAVWYFNSALWIMTVISWLLLIICFCIFSIVYFFPFIRRENKNR